MAPLIFWFVVSDLILAANLWNIAQRKSKWNEIFVSLAVIVLLGAALLPMYIVNQHIAARRQWKREHPHELRSGGH